MILVAMPPLSATEHDTGTALDPVQLWLAAMAILVFAMIVVGGATRLTDSGLSITEWRPLLGAIPPLDAADWRAAFDKYKEIPEYHAVNKGTSLDAFKFIYWWEWTHRFLGRFIGVAFAVPFAFFWATGRLAAGLAPRLLGILALGALQGGIGWYMVQSGLVDRVDVSQYRLALHLGVAFLILGLIVWVALLLEPPKAAPEADRSQRWLAAVLAGLILLQVVLGALVAGLKAGLAYNTWPLMDGRLVPEGLGTLDPWYLNLTENITSVQFNHRMAAYAIVLVASAHAWALWRRRMLDTSAVVLVIAVLGQVGLGVATLLAHAPLGLALVHQAGAAALFVIAVWHLRRMVRCVTDFARTRPTVYNTLPSPD